MGSVYKIGYWKAFLELEFRVTCPILMLEYGEVIWFLVDYYLSQKKTKKFVYIVYCRDLISFFVT
jgi:hypothetical protein